MSLISQPNVSVVIVNWNTVGLLHNCLHSLGAASTGDTLEIIVVDNASQDDSAAMVQREFPTVRLIENVDNLGFARANNQGLAISQGRYVLLLNSDTLAQPNSISALVAFMDEHPQAGAVSPRLRRPNGTPQPFAFGNDPTLRYLLRRAFNRLVWRRSMHDWHTLDTLRVHWVSGACLLVRRAVYERIGGLDEAIFMYFEDNDWCLRMRNAGWAVYYHPAASIIHLGGQSSARNPKAGAFYADSLCYFYRKHYSPLAQFALAILLPWYQRMMPSE